MLNWIQASWSSLYLPICLFEAVLVNVYHLLQDLMLIIFGWRVGIAKSSQINRSSFCWTPCTCPYLECSSFNLSSFNHQGIISISIIILHHHHHQWWFTIIIHHNKRMAQWSAAKALTETRLRIWDYHWLHFTDKHLLQKAYNCYYENIALTSHT